MTNRKGMSAKHDRAGMSEQALESGTESTLGWSQLTATVSHEQSLWAFHEYSSSLFLEWEHDRANQRRLAARRPKMFDPLGTDGPLHEPDAEDPVANFLNRIWNSYSAR